MSYRDFLSMKKSIESIKLERLNRLQLSPSRLLELTKDNNKDDRPKTSDFAVVDVVVVVVVVIY